ncbi:MAG: GTPase Era [Alphaproteobacteria bacterium]|nr:MAG: GTPase Era [Alphaproteobacteria bacterium]
MISMDDMRCGLVALVGLPNAGKSTLMNAIVGEKVGIISNKPNTTRITVRGVLTEGVNQLVFMDTPGWNRSAKAFDRRLVQQAAGAAAEADIVAILADIGGGAAAFGPDVRELVDQAKQRQQKVVLVVTKIDKLKSKEALLPLLGKLNDWNVDAVVPLAAIKADPHDGQAKGANARKVSGVERLVAELVKLIPDGPWLFPPEQVTDIPLKLRLAELTREQAMRQLHQELPYQIGVITESVEEVEDDDGNVTLIHQQLLVSKEQHKPMVLGNRGQMLKKIGTFSRLEMQKVVGERVRLELHVKVAEKWLEREQWLREMGV